jgi:MFS family permease
MPVQQGIGTLSHSFTSKRRLKLLILINATSTFAIGMFAPFYAVFVDKIGGDAALAGASWALFSVISGVFILLLSKWELRVKRRHVLLALGYLIRASVFLSYAFMTSIPQLLITQVLWGIASAIGTPAFDALYNSEVSEEAAIVEWGDWEGVAAIATGVAALVGGLLIQTIGFQVLFILMSVIMTLLGGHTLYQRFKIKHLATA